MYRSYRRSPRVPTAMTAGLSLPTDNMWEGEFPRAGAVFSVARGGLGLRLPTASVRLTVGDTALVGLDLGYTQLRLAVGIAWLCMDDSQGLLVGCELSPETDLSSSVVEYRAWVKKKYMALRGSSEQIGARLVQSRQLTLRELQDALDLQARNGGYLTQVVSNMRRQQRL